MRVGVYNRWLSTMGGGEQHMGAIALELARHHDVELLTHDPVDLVELRGLLGIDLTGLPVRMVLLDHAYRSLERCTRDYDLFVNCSHLDIFRARACWNAMLVFFPGPLPPDDGAFAGGHLFALGGLHAHEGSQLARFRWTDGSAQILLRDLEPGRDHRLRLLLRSARPPGIPPVRVRLFLGNVPLGGVRRLPPWMPAVVEEVIPGKVVLDKQMILRVESDTFAEALGDDARQLGIRFMGVGLWGPGWEAWRTARSLPPFSSVRANTEGELDTYQLLLANSLYTQGWVRERWHRPSEVLYPLVGVDGLAPAEKRQQIVSVGRFFTGSHNKKHLVMIEAFRKLCDEGLTGWEYHLVGGTHPEPGHQAYLREVRSAAEGYPIQIHTDISLTRLRELYGASDLYWNATGFGEDEQTFPDAFEHFGITTVEAMASGAVPVSFARAGQLETIQHGENGMLWEQIEECQAHSLALMADPARRARMGQAAVARSRAFGPHAFRANLDRLVEMLLERGPAGLGGPQQRRTARHTRSISASERSVLEGR